MNMTMRLQAEYEYAKTLATNKVTDNDLYEHVLRVGKEDRYNHLDVRIAHDLKFATMSSATVCTWYDKYGCNDDHVTTLYKQVLKNNYPKSWETIQYIMNL